MSGFFGSLQLGSGHSSHCWVPVTALLRLVALTAQLFAAGVAGPVSQRVL